MTPKNIGKFKVSGGMVYNETDKVVQLFKKMDLIVVRAELHWDSLWGTLEYVGLSPLFEEVEDGGLIPEYDIVMTAISEENNEGVYHTKVGSVRADKLPPDPIRPKRFIELSLDD